MDTSLQRDQYKALTGWQRRRLERAERHRLRLQAMMEESDRLQRELNELLTKEREYANVPPRKPLPPWPTLGHVLSAAEVYAGVALLSALLFVIGAVIYSFPVVFASFTAGVLVTIMGVRLWRRILRRSSPTLFDRMWKRFYWDHYARN